MTKINTTFEVQNHDFLGKDTCNLCSFKEHRLDDKPCRCKIFNKVLDRFNPSEKYGLVHWRYIRLQECKDSEIKEDTDEILEIGTRVKIVNIDEDFTDIHGIENGDLGTIIGHGSEGFEYLIKFDILKEGSTTNIGCYINKNNIEKIKNEDNLNHLFTVFQRMNGEVHIDINRNQIPDNIDKTKLFQLLDEFENKVIESVNELKGKIKECEVETDE